MKERGGGGLAALSHAPWMHVRVRVNSHQVVLLARTRCLFLQIPNDAF